MDNTKYALALCSTALNHLAPSPSASMVRISGGYMESFGGTYAIKVPFKVEVGCCFSPNFFGTFFRKERKATSFTIHKNKLVLSEGKEKLSIPCLPEEELVTIDVLSKPRKVTFDMTYLKLATDIVDPAHSKLSAQGIQFRYGMIEATNGRTLLGAKVGFHEDVEFNLPVASAKALLRFKSEVVGVAQDLGLVKFLFADGSSLTSLAICEDLVDTSPFYGGEWTSIKLKTDVAKDLLTIDCDDVIFFNGNAAYVKGVAEGILSNVCSNNFDVKVSKENLDVMLKVSADIRLSKDGNRFMAVSEKCRIISTTKR
jgi:hypothetical protein